MTAINKVCFNIDQTADHDDSERLRARTNIGACKHTTVSQSSSYATVLAALNAGDVVEFVESAGSYMSRYPFAYISSSGIYFAKVSIDGTKLVRWRVSLTGVWTNDSMPLEAEWTQAAFDNTVTTPATTLFTMGSLIVGYYFDNSAQFRLAMKSTSGTRYVAYTDETGHTGGGSEVTESGWTYLSMYGFSNSNQFVSFCGYDSTASKFFRFQVYFSNPSNSSFKSVLLYRILNK